MNNFFKKVILIILIVFVFADQPEEQMSIKFNSLNWSISEPSYELILEDEGYLLYVPNGSGYRYGASLIEENDIVYGWFSSPGNNSTEWDYIRFYPNIEKSENEIVLKPTKNSLDSCSVCDPGIIFFNDYYYMVYTSTSDYSSNGYNNSLFAARSKSPEGPYEKWNGNGWGGNPAPIIQYWGSPEYWGIGEGSLVIYDDELFIYYSDIDQNGYKISLAKSDLSENWPATIKYNSLVAYRNTGDSFDVVFDDYMNLFFAFSIENRMEKGSTIGLYKSSDGKEFELVNELPIEDFSHNVGVAKNKTGHINSSSPLVISYAYGEEWGKWSNKIIYASIKESF